MTKKPPKTKRRAAPNHSRKTKPDLRGTVVGTRQDSGPGIDATMPERVRWAMHLLGETGDPPERIVDQICDRFNVSRRQAARYVARAREKMTRLLDREAPHARAQRIARLRVASRMAQDIRDPKGIVAAEKEIADLQGLYVEQRKVDTTMGMTPEVQGLLSAIALNPYDQQRRLQELEAKARGEVPGRRSGGNDKETP